MHSLGAGRFVFFTTLQHTLFPFRAIKFVLCDGKVEMSVFICYALNRKKLLGNSKQFYNYEEVIMRNSIRKIASLCLAMTMILSLFAVPAFAEERAIHTHSYDTVVTSDTEVFPYSDTQHVFETTTYRACECGTISAPIITTHYANHVFPGSGTFEYSFTEESTGITINYYSYTCSVCDYSIIRAGH